MSTLRLLDLPFEVLVNIFSNLRPRDLRNLMSTCRALKEFIINENTLWRNRALSELTLQSNGSSTLQSTLMPPLPIYHRCRISHNWCNGIYRDKVVIQHDTSYMPWLQLISHYLLLSVGSTLQCYSIENKKATLLWEIEVPKVQRQDIRTNDISRFSLKDNILVCGNRDGSTAIYKLVNLTKPPRLIHYIRDAIDDGLVEVSTVELVASSSQQLCVVTGSCRSSHLSYWQWPSENNFNIWHEKFHADTPSYKHITLPDNFCVRCLKSNNTEDKLSLGVNGNNKPILLDVETGKLITSPIEYVRKQAVRDLQWHDPHTVTFVTHSGILQSLDYRSDQVVYNSMDPFHSTLYCVKTDGDRAIIVGSSEYSRCVLFDRRKSTRHVQMYFTQKKSSPIYCLDFDPTKLIAAADRSVAILNFNINAAKGKIRNYSELFEVVSHR